jgi:hypothetical protein
MNKRIKQLIDEVGTDVSGKWMNIENVEKFTEQITKECAGFIQDLVDQRIPASEYPTRLIEHFRIGENFGIDKNLRNRSTYFGNNP